MDTGKEIKERFLKRTFYTMFEFFGMLAAPVILAVILSKFFGHLVLFLVLAFVISWIYIIRRVLSISKEWNMLENIEKNNKSDNTKENL